MNEEKTAIQDVASEVYDASEQPFDFVEEGQSTALICEPDASVRSKMEDSLKETGYLVTVVESAQDALKKMRYHIYDVVVVNENFDCDDPAANTILAYLEELNIQVRRRIFVALTGSRFRTMDNMTAFNRSVNLTINLDNTDETGLIIKRGVAENKAFYRGFREILADSEGRS